MTKNIFKIKVKKQNYFKELLIKYPSLKSGRKNYNHNYLRILRNILILKYFKLNKGKINNMFQSNFKCFVEITRRSPSILFCFSDI